MPRHWNTKITDENKAEMRLMHSDGKNIKEMAIKFNVTQRSIRMHLKAMGLKIGNGMQGVPKPRRNMVSDEIVYSTLPDEILFNEKMFLGI